MQVVSIAAKTQTSVGDWVDDVTIVPRGNTVLVHALPNKQTKAHKSVAVQMLQHWRDVVILSSTADEPGSAVLHTLQTLQRCLRKAV